MPRRPIHHLVLCVEDLDAARQAYMRLGFALTPPARHPFGTANSLVQLQGNYLELLALADPAAIPAAAPGRFSFGAYNRDFLDRRQGMSMLVFLSEDARRDQREFAAAGLDTYAPFDFSRLARLPDGSEAIVAFSLAFVTDPRLPEAAFFTCEVHAPEHFWKPEYQRHANGALAVDEVVMVASEPAALAPFFGKLLAPGAVDDRGGRLVVTTPRGRLSVLAPEGFARRFPGMSIIDAPATPYFAAYRVKVAALSAAEATLHANGMPYRRKGDTLQVAPEESFGVAIEFAAG